MAAFPSMAPSAIADVRKVPEAGYSSTRPWRGSADAKACPMIPCGRCRAATPPRARSEISRRWAGPEMRSYTQFPRTTAVQSPMV